MSKRPVITAVCLILLLVFAAPLPAASVYETPAEFLGRAFGKTPPAPTVVWLSGETKLDVGQILGHDYPALRLRYWRQAGRTAWILEEIGKDLPITVGVIIDRDHIQSLRVLTYRENRGGEVARPAFTDQFNRVSLDTGGTLDTAIDAISGATLSVRALTRLATMALYLNRRTGDDNGP